MIKSVCMALSNKYFQDTDSQLDINMNLHKYH
jgi:hypothetical protein